MVDASKIGWGHYREYEGPFFKGNAPFKFPEDPSENHKRLAVITATEGGRYNAYNGYDRCICSLGLIQWCEAKYYLVSTMLGYVADLHPEALQPLHTHLAKIRAEFKKNHRDRYRFFFKDERGEVDQGQEQKQLFLLNSSGLRNSWDEESKYYAKQMASVLASVFEDNNAQNAQAVYTAKKLIGFATKQAQQILFGHEPSGKAEDWVGAAQAAYLSYAANLPAVASKHIIKYQEQAGDFQPNQEWVVGMLKQLTFGPSISIYPHRYNAIRPVLEKLYKIDLPDFAKELKEQEDFHASKVDIDIDDDFDKLKEPKAVQEALISLGFDLGPHGADGVIGRKTLAALMAFQQHRGLKVDGVIGSDTRKKLWEAITGRYC